jgi:hydroxymethylbilane synthase
MEKIRIGSRPSKLALIQANYVRARLASLMPEVEVEVVGIRTSGDKLTTASLAQLGGKGLFIKELEQALGAGVVDLAVHSMKDLPARLAPQFKIAAVPERENTADVLVTRDGAALTDLPRKARLGTSSPRRRFQALRVNREISVTPLRGNVDTRIGRVADGSLDAIIVAVAGLKRLGRTGDVKFVELDAADFIPSGGQGALAIETLTEPRAGASLDLANALEAINDDAARYETAAERAFLAAIGASCTTPVGVRASIADAVLSLRAMLFSPDGSRVLTDSLEAPVEFNLAPKIAAAAGELLAKRMIANGAAAMLANE